MLTKFFPFLDWFKGYKVGDFKIDFLAGLTVALVLIPQSMAYAQLAGLPAYYGLYAAFLPPMVAALFGSSRQLATGPVAVVSLMSAASLEPLATAGSPEFIAYSIVLALVVGIFQFSLGVLRLGMDTAFLGQLEISQEAHGDLMPEHQIRAFLTSVVLPQLDLFSRQIETEVIEEEEVALEAEVGPAP